MSEIIDENFKPSIRGLEEGFPTIPLRKFTGTFKGWSHEPILGEGGVQTGKMRVKLEFVDLDMDTLESDEPYLFPVCELPITYSKKKTSGWGVFSESLIALVHAESDLDDAIGNVMTIEREDKHLFFTAKDGTKAEGTVWRVIAMQGVGTAPSATAPAGAAVGDPDEIALVILSGKTADEFKQAALSDPVLKGLPDTIISIVSGGFLTKMEAAKRVVLDPTTKKYIKL